MAKIFPFPAARQLVLVERIAHSMARRTADDAERYLLRQVEIEYGRQIELGIARPIVEDDVVAFASAIRAALWRVTFSQPGGVG